MTASLDSLIKTNVNDEFNYNIAKENLSNTYNYFKNIIGYNDDTIQILLLKGIYPYSWMDTINKLNTPDFPKKEDFYNNLTDKHIKEEDYLHAVNVYKKLNCETFEKYHDTYLTCDIFYYVMFLKILEIRL